MTHAWVGVLMLIQFRILGVEAIDKHVNLAKWSEARWSRRYLTILVGYEYLGFDWRALPVSRKVPVSYFPRMSSPRIDASLSP